MSYISQLYYKDLQNFYKKIVPLKSKHIIINTKLPKGKYDYLILENSFSHTDDIQEFIKKLKRNCKDNTRVVAVYFNFFWKPILNLASQVGLRKKDEKEPNWLSSNDISSLFKLEGFEKVKFERRFLFPFGRILSQVPLFNYFCLTTCQVFRLVPSKREYSVSIIIPAKNEEGNIKGVLKKIPYLGKGTEVIFVEGNSKDKTYETIKNEIKGYEGKIKAKLFKQTGRGKGNAVKLGFKKAKGDILMILDADLTVAPSDLKKFYDAISFGHGDFINGSRLVYPMERQAMRMLNYMGNYFFSVAFTYLLNQRIKDTLCGTKVLFRKDYLRILANMKDLGDFDPFGDFNLLFGATRLNLKIIEIPVRYKERVYGKTNINRFKNGIGLLKMTWIAAKRIKFI